MEILKEYISVNGLITIAQEGTIPAKDQGLLFGWGLFETLRVYDGKSFMLQEHLSRMASSAQQLDIPMPSFSTINQYVSEFIEKAKQKNGVLRITLTKGVDNSSNLILTQRENPYSKEAYEKGFRIKTSEIKRNPSSPLSYMKTIGYMDNLLAKQDAIKDGYDDALLLNTDGYLAECSTSNLFFIKGKSLYTPSLSCGLLNGIVRNLIFKQLSNACGLKVYEGKYCLKDLLHADEVFVSNSVLQIMPVTVIDHHIIVSELPQSYTEMLISQYALKI